MISSIGSGSAGSTYAASRGSAASSALTQTAKAEQHNPLQQVFNSIDSDGSLGNSELSAALKSSDSDDSPSIDIDGLLGLFDQDSGGTVSESEFAHALQPPRGGAEGGASAGTSSADSRSVSSSSSAQDAGTLLAQLASNQYRSFGRGASASSSFSVAA